MHFHPSNVQFYGGGCKVLNYYNLKHSPAHAFPKDTRDSWLKQSQYIPPTDPPKQNLIVNIQNYTTQESNTFIKVKK